MNHDVKSIVHRYIFDVRYGMLCKEYDLKWKKWFGLYNLNLNNDTIVCNQSFAYHLNGKFVFHMANFRKFDVHTQEKSLSIRRWCFNGCRPKKYWVPSKHYVRHTNTRDTRDTRDTREG